MTLHGEMGDLAAILEQLARGERGMVVPFWPARDQDMLGAAALVGIVALRDVDHPRC